MLNMIIRPEIIKLNSNFDNQLYKWFILEENISLLLYIYTMKIHINEIKIKT